MVHHLKTALIVSLRVLLMSMVTHTPPLLDSPPLNTTDGGDYQCIGTVRSEEVEENILSSTSTGELRILVEGTCSHLFKS